MNILVCIKQVPDETSKPELTANGMDLVNDDKKVYRMNRLDEYALEEAVRIKEEYSDVVVDVVSVGPERIRSTIRKGLEKGADYGFHIPMEDGAYISPLSVSTEIAARDRDYDIILAGVMAEDDMQCQTGPMIAAILDIPCAVSVIKEDLDRDNGKILVECELEGGMRERATLPLPCLLTIQSGINRPRYPSLSNVLRAKSQHIPEVRSGSIMEGREGLVSLSYPERSSRITMIDGTAEEKAEKLLAMLHERSLL